ncbi:hypothetical protein F5144DRAFT_211113 [Chaetomium tenue]|uniref:Uncharacterized protein n=1 Tax=Chaetomium tenue TaxID=1854479 RepID=A0ACB7PG83_9PEZI|nr:hypothetical protein F5144DRAFT_211113 [Chaetomium globosum]
MAGVGAADAPGRSGDSGNRGNGAGDTIAGPSTMICPRCNTRRPVSMFYGKKGGLVGSCTSCRDDKAATRRQEVVPYSHFVTPLS